MLFYWRTSTIFNQVHVRPNTNRLLANESNSNSEDIFKNCDKEIEQKFKEFKSYFEKEMNKLNEKINSLIPDNIEESHK